MPLVAQHQRDLFRHVGAHLRQRWGIRCGHEPDHKKSRRAQHFDAVGKCRNIGPRMIEDRAHRTPDRAPIQGITACGITKGRIDPQGGGAADDVAQIHRVHDPFEYENATTRGEEIPVFPWSGAGKDPHRFANHAESCQPLQHVCRNDEHGALHRFGPGAAITQASIDQDRNRCHSACDRTANHEAAFHHTRRHHTISRWGRTAELTLRITQPAKDLEALVIGIGNRNQRHRVILPELAATASAVRL